MKCARCGYLGKSAALTKTERSFMVVSGINRARKNGKTLGRPKKIDVRLVLKMWGDGKTVKQIAKALVCSVRSIQVAVKNEVLRE